LTYSDASCRSGKLARLSVAVLLVAAFLVWTAPAGLAQRPILGSVSATGAAEVRGMAVAGDTTLFSGDRIRTRSDAYVRVLLAGGPQVELGADSAVEIDRDEAGFHLRVTGGRVVFSAPPDSAPVTVEAGSVEVAARGGAAAEIAWLDPARVRVLALRERVTVVQEGEGQEAEAEDDDEVIINLDAAVESGDEETPAQVGEDGSGGSVTTWVLAGAGAGAAVGTVIFLAGGEKEPASPTAP
jgi:ferric-dicitrate binding protein FerR (iron transport regulator)